MKVRTATRDKPGASKTGGKRHQSQIGCNMDSAKVSPLFSFSRSRWIYHSQIRLEQSANAQSKTLFSVLWSIFTKLMHAVLADLETRRARAHQARRRLLERSPPGPPPLLFPHAPHAFLMHSCLSDQCRSRCTPTENTCATYSST